MNIIGNVKKSNPLLKKGYSKALLTDYMNSRGLKSVDLGSSFTIMDIEAFIKERKNSTERYARMLDALTLDYRESNTIENIDCKEFLITRTCDFDTTVATSDKKIYDCVRADRVLLGNIKVFNGIPTLANKVGSGYHFRTLDNTGFKTIMKTNPQIEAIKYFSNLKRISGFNLIIGVNGSIYDYDRYYKEQAIYNLGNRLDNNFIKFHYEDDTNYMTLVASRELKRIK